MNDPQTQPNIIASVSQAAEHLCVWLRAIHSYCTIFRQLQPKKNSLKEAERKKAKVMRVFKIFCNIGEILLKSIPILVEIFPILLLNPQFVWKYDTYPLRSAL